MPSALKSRTTYTIEESQAWRHYPYAERIKPASSLSHALRLYRQRFDPNEACQAEVHARRRAEQCAARKRRYEQLATLPELCYKDQHPSGCGRPGKLYHKHDNLRPICDSITVMYEKLGGAVGGGGASDAFGLFADAPKSRRARRKPDGYDEQEAAEEEAVARARAVRRGELRDDGRWRCENKLCNNEDVHSIIDTLDGRVCPCGTMVRGANIQSEAEWRCHADDDEGKNERKKRAETAPAPKSMAEREIEGEALGKEERAAARRGAARGTGVNGSGLCIAQKKVEQDRERDQRALSELTAREEVKRTRIVEELNKMFKKLKPIDHQVQKEVRRTAHELYKIGARHAHACERVSCCELRLVDRSPFIIASSVFSHTVDSILSPGGGTELAGVDREHIVDLQMRLQRSVEFTNSASLAQMATAKAMITLMKEEGFDACRPCAPPAAAAPPVREAKTTPSMRGVRLTRVDSDLGRQLGGTPGSPMGDQLPLRNALATVFLAHKSELPTSVRDGAVRALRAPGFVVSCRGLECLKNASLNTVAFCVLNAVAREQADTVGPSFANGAQAGMLNVPVAHKLNLDLVVAEEAITAIRHFVPTDAASEASAPPEDDLFV